MILGIIVTKFGYAQFKKTEIMPKVALKIAKQTLDSKMKQSKKVDRWKKIR